MKIIADSGSTKTDWVLINDSGETLTYSSKGLNPNLVSEETIQEELLKLKKEFNTDLYEGAFYFYGSGCGSDQGKLKIEEALHKIYPNTNAFVNTDIYGAALSLLHDQKGIAAILGTGMNACLFDGKNIVKTIPSLGYIIGDEGSGSYFGKKLLNKIFTKDIDKTLIEKFHHRYQLSREDIIKNTYGKERANKFLASFCPFIHDNKLHSDLQTMLMEGFNGFYRKYISHISQNDSIYFTGSIAHYFKEELIESAECYGYKVMEVMKSPMDGLIKYHSI